MPQFDFYSFSSQVFWVVLGFFLFYFFILKFYLVYFAEIYKMRNKLVNAQKLNNLELVQSKQKLYSLFFF